MLAACKGCFSSGCGKWAALNQPSLPLIFDEPQFIHFIASSVAIVSAVFTLAN